MAKQKTKKRLVFYFDGSWNRIDAPYPTNVLYTEQSVLPLAGDIAQIIFYDEGVGTEKGEELKGGMFGEGLVKNLSDGSRTLIFNYTPGDEIYVFGFSRGAFTARSFVGLISNCGILRRRDAGRSNEAIELYQQRPKEPTSEYANRMLEFRSECSPDICVSAEEDEWRVANIPEYARGTGLPLKVKYMGIWDTVGSLGIPDDIVGAAHINAKHQFHNFALSGMVESARHAVAIDKRRKTFRPTLWDNLDALNGEAGVDSAGPKSPYQQQWFPGVHGSVGGGGEPRLRSFRNQRAWLRQEPPSPAPPVDRLNGTRGASGGSFRIETVLLDECFRAPNGSPGGSGREFRKKVKADFRPVEGFNLLALNRSQLFPSEINSIVDHRKELIELVVGQ